MKHVLVSRLDSAGDVLLAGPAIRSVAAGADRVTLLCGPRGRAAAELLPGVDDLLEFEAPWIDPEPNPLDGARVDRLIEEVAAQNAKAKDLKVDSLIDISVVKELEDSGFIKQIYAG